MRSIQRCGLLTVFLTAGFAACLVPLAILIAVLSEHQWLQMHDLTGRISPVIAAAIIIATLTPWWLFLLTWIEYERRTIARRIPAT